MEKIDCKKLTVSQKTANFIGVFGVVDELWGGFDNALSAFGYSSEERNSIIHEHGFADAINVVRDIIRTYMIDSIDESLLNSNRQRL